MEPTLRQLAVGLGRQLPHLRPLINAGRPLNPKSTRRLATTAEMVHHKHKTVVLGGGNASGYCAWEWVKRGAPGRDLAIITDEPVRQEGGAAAARAGCLRDRQHVACGMCTWRSAP